MVLTSASFSRAVATLRARRQTVTVVESTAGGLINAGLMAVAGSSAVYIGGSVSYNTRRCRKLLLDDSGLHDALLAGAAPKDGDSAADYYQGDWYMNSKQVWTSKTAVAFCDALQTDYAIAEAGAAGPTFRQAALQHGFTWLCVAGRTQGDGAAAVLSQRLVRSQHADRHANMLLFADAAAQLLCDTLSGNDEE